MKLPVILACFVCLLARGSLAQEIENVSKEQDYETTTTVIPLIDLEEDDSSSSQQAENLVLPTPTLSSNVVQDLVPSLKKNIMNAKSIESEEQSGQFLLIQALKTPLTILNFSDNSSEALYKRRPDPVRNSTAAEILLRKLQNTHRVRTYHDPGFKSNKKIVRVRPRVKSFEELKSKAENGTVGFASSPILASNAILMDQNHQDKSFAPQGAQPFDWSQRKGLKNRFRLFKTPEAKEATEATSTSSELPPTSSTEVNVVTSHSDEIREHNPKKKSSYSFVSIGTQDAKDNVLELERLFLNEKLQSSDQEEREKIKRKVTGFFLDKKEPVQVDSSITVVSDLYENNPPITQQFKPSTKPPTKYKAPAEPFELPDLAADKNDQEDQEDSEKSGMNLDDMIISAIEGALNVQVPDDETLRHRDQDQNHQSSNPLVRFAKLPL